MDKVCADINKDATDSDRYAKIISDIKIEPIDNEFSNYEQGISSFEQVYLDSVTEDQKPVQNLKTEEVIHAHNIDIKEELCVYEDNGTDLSKQLQFIKEEINADNKSSNFTHDFKLCKEEIEDKDMENVYEKEKKFHEDISNIELDLNQPSSFEKNMSIHQSVSRISADSISKHITGSAVQNTILYTDSKTENPIVNNESGSTLKKAEKYIVNPAFCESLNVPCTKLIFQKNIWKKCNFCARTFKKESHLQTHMLNHRDLPQIKCSKCDQSFTEITLSEHFKSFHSDSFKCANCSSVFKTLGLFKDHMLQNINCAEWKCLECNHIFSNQSTFKKHMLRRHTNPRLFTCLECNQNFFNKYNLKMHMLTHIKPEWTDCPKCNPDSSTGSVLKRRLCMIHASVVHHTCTKCNKDFQHSSSLKRHMVIHVDPNLLTCSVCNKTFSRKYYLNEHMLKHTNPVLFKCPDCNKHFSKRCTLKNHMLVHTDPDKLKCSDCDKMFTNISYYKEHMLKHTNPQLFACPECNKSFSYRKLLDGHMLVHTNPDQLKCSICCKCFDSLVNYKRHMLKHTFKCEECGKYFRSKNMLSKHMLFH